MYLASTVKNKTNHDKLWCKKEELNLLRKSRRRPVCLCTVGWDRPRDALFNLSKLGFSIVPCSMFHVPYSITKLKEHSREIC